MNFERLPPGTPDVILARVEMDYRKPAKYGDVLEVRLALEKIGRTSFTYVYEIVDKSGDIVANARTVLVSYDYSAQKPVVISDEVRSRLGSPK